MIKVIVVGSESFNDKAKLKEECNKALSKQPTVEIVVNGTKGTSFIAQEYATEKKYKTKVIVADRAKYGDNAGKIRNAEMVEYADAMIAFWDGEHKGTEHIIKIAQLVKMKLKVVRV